MLSTNNIRKLLTGLVLVLAACNNNSRKPAEDSTAVPPVTVAAPAFQADSAYRHIATQLAFGPRIPGTPAQQKCADWIIHTLRPLADTVYVQKATVTAAGNKQLPCINIIASFNPDARQRILLLTHWDTRPVADKDAFDKKQRFDGADDGASGTAVLMETARLLHAQKPAYGIDILFTDVEDYGETYCLGTQYWAKNPHRPGYTANYGILLDMVGGRNALYYMEGTSKQFASAQMKKFWDAANAAGYSNYFRYEEPINGTIYIEDDHTYVNSILHIPTFDIIATQSNGDLMLHHHTTLDNLSVIDTRTLQAVGQPLLNVLYGDPFNY